MTAVTGVMVVLALLLAPYVRAWLEQRSDIAAAGAKVEQLQRDVDVMTIERRRWNDPAYVKAQARERLYLVMPGDTGFVVLDGGDQAAKASSSQAQFSVSPSSARDPWYATVWKSIERAGSTAPRDVPQGPAVR